MFKKILLVCSLLVPCSIYANVLEINSNTVKDTDAAKRKLTIISMVNEGCLTKTGNDSTKSFNCLLNVSNSINKFRNTYLQTLTQKEKSTFFSTIDIATQKNIKSCETAFPENERLKFKVAIINCKNRMTISALTYSLEME